MSHGHERRVGGTTLAATAAAAPVAGPGKRTLTEGLAVQQTLAKERPKVPGASSRAGGDGDLGGAAPSSMPASQPASEPVDGGPASLPAGRQADAGPAVEPNIRAAPQVDSTQGATPATTPAPPVGPAWVKGSHVTPTFTVTEVVGARSNSASSTTHANTPTYTGHVALDGSNWRYGIASVTGTGKITLVYYTDDHYPAPTPTDDSGPLTNVSKTNWTSMVADLKAHRTGIGGAWSAYRAETLHEHYHWETEWQGQVKKALTKLETDIESLSVSTSTAKTAADAEKILKPQVDAAFAKAMADARKAYDALGDSPGDAPYIAQAPAIDALVARIEAHAKAQGW